VLCVLLGVMDVSRGSLAWLWRQTHDLESMSPIKRGPEVAGSNPAPGTNRALAFYQNPPLVVTFISASSDPSPAVANVKL
jgi:hypothetical protein